MQVKWWYLGTARRPRRYAVVARRPVCPGV